VKPVTEADLHSYVDGGLSESAKAEIEAWLRAHPEDAERMRAYAEQNAMLRSFYNPVLDEPVPARFLRCTSVRGSATPRRRRYSPPESAGWFARESSSRHSRSAVARAAGGDGAHRVRTGGAPSGRSAGQRGSATGRVAVEAGWHYFEAPKLAPLGYDLVGGRLLSGPGSGRALHVSGRARPAVDAVCLEAAGEPRDTAFRFSQEDRVSVFYWVDGKLRLRAFRRDERTSSSRSPKWSTSSSIRSSSPRCGAWRDAPRAAAPAVPGGARSTGRHGRDVKGQELRHHKAPTTARPSDGVRPARAEGEARRQASHEAANVVIMIGRKRIRQAW